MDGDLHGRMPSTPEQSYLIAARSRLLAMFAVIDDRSLAAIRMDCEHVLWLAGRSADEDLCGPLAEIFVGGSRKKVTTRK